MYFMCNCIMYFYKLNLVGVRDVRWDKKGTVRTGNCNFFYGKKIEKMGWARHVARMGRGEACVRF
jgi:hypothetical protein